MSNVIQFPAARQSVARNVEANAVPVSEPVEPVAYTAAEPIVLNPLPLIINALAFYAGNGRVKGQGQDDGKRARHALNCLQQAGVIAIQS